MSAPATLPIHKEAQNLANEVLYRAECHITAERFNSNVHFFVGMTAAGLAAAAGGTAFAGQTIVAGVAGVAAAVLSGFLTVYKPDERTQAHATAARAHKKLYDRIDLQFRLGLPPTPADDLDGVYAGFRTEAAELDQTSFPVSRRLCTKAEAFRAARDEWYPPADDRFEEWANRRWTVHGSWFGRAFGNPGKVVK